ncbi:MAG: nucleotide-binding protein [Armatimonadota bacterium]|nr:nucleotide-binding protein [Armatimonadota bacterium]
MSNSQSQPPTLRMPVARAKEALEAQIAKGEELLARDFSSEQQFDSVQEDYFSWSEYNKTLLETMFSDASIVEEYRDVALVLGGRSSFGEEVRELIDRIRRKIRRLKSIRDRVGLFAREDEGDALAKSMGGSGKSEALGGSVFIIHGHDYRAALELRDLLQDEHGLQVVLMEQEPHAGRTLIEKFEEEAEPCGFAVAVFTPDDVVTKGEDAEYAQMRPNVVFELGWFCARLGRPNVAILYKEGTTMPSDLSGVAYYKFHESPEECWRKLRDELKRAGLLADED